MVAINVLGTDYFVHVGDFPNMENLDGEINYAEKLIYISGKVFNEYFLHTALKHEIIHAFLFESGLSVNSNNVLSWATNEEMIDFFALQYDKINKTIKSCEYQVENEWREANA